MSYDEWHFFAGWIKRTTDLLTGQIIQGDFLDNQRKEDFTKGIITALNMFLADAERFKTKAETARRKIKEIEDGK
jgi:SRSO17 transposase